MRSARAFVLIVVLVLTVPTASAAPRSGDDPSFTRERVVRVIKKFLRMFGVSSDSEQISVPRP